MYLTQRGLNAFLEPQELFIRGAEPLTVELGFPFGLILRRFQTLGLSTSTRTSSAAAAHRSGWCSHRAFLRPGNIYFRVPGPEPRAPSPEPLLGVQVSV